MIRYPLHYYYNYYYYEPFGWEGGMSEGKPMQREKIRSLTVQFICIYIECRHLLTIMHSCVMHDLRDKLQLTNNTTGV